MPRAGTRSCQERALGHRSAHREVAVRHRDVQEAQRAGLETPAATASQTVRASSDGAPSGRFAADGGGVLAEDVVERSSDPRCLDRGGWWAASITFEGEPRLWRFARVRPAKRPAARRVWWPVPPAAWTSSLDQRQYCEGVAEI